MDVVKQAPSETLRPPLAARSIQAAELRLPSRIRLALGLLLEALDYGQDLGSSVWDFAVEIASLRRLQLSSSDLRWLVGKGLVEHAVEVTLAVDAERSFRQSAKLLFFKKTCFVITPAGAMLARGLQSAEERVSSFGGSALDRQTAITLPVQPLVPTWDRDRQELRVGSAVVKQFRVPAGNQETILAAFEEERWPPRIDDPLPPHSEQSPKRRLQETIKSLNRNQKRPLLRFLGDGSGQGVRWEFWGDRS